MDVTATAANGEMARIVGAQVASNTNDSHVLGGFSVTVKGLIIDMNFATGKGTPVGPGETHCTTDVTPVTAPFRGPASNTFGAEVHDNGDPS